MMLPGMNPKKMAAMMKQLGMKQEGVDAERVVIEKIGGGRIVINNPGVMKVVMQGQETWQISGEAVEEVEEGISDEDIKLVSEKTGKSEEEARKVLKETNDIAEAIIKLSN